MKGKQFENYLFLKIKHLNPAYIFEDETEIDFVIRAGERISSSLENPSQKTILSSDSIQARLLAEIKYQSDLSPKQKVLFDRFQAEEKMVIKNLDHVLQLEKFLDSP